MQTVDAIIHPIETIKNSIVGIGVIAYGLGYLVAIPVECAFLSVVDNDRYQIKKDVILRQLEKISDATMCYAQTTPTREMVNEANGKNLLREGSNDIIKKLNGLDATVRVFIKDNVVLSLDGFRGLSSRIVENKICL